MTTIHEIAAKYRISLKKLRRMERDGDIKFETSSPITEQIRWTFRNGDRLTVPQLVALIEDPSILHELGDKEAKVRAQLAELGNPVEPASMEEAMHLSFAASGDVNAIQILLDWCKSVIPANRTVSHHYLAVRLLLGVSENLRQFEAPRLGRVMLNLRKHPDFAGWWRIEKQGSRNVTVYARPGGFDL